VPEAMDDRNTNGSPTNQSMNDLCHKYMNYHVIAQMADGSRIEGIIEDVNDQGVVMQVPEALNENDRYFYGPGPGPRPRYRHFNRFFFPFLLFSIPFLFPYPFY
jgi:hypothetical protein